MRGTKFRYTGRTEREILTESLNALRQQHLLNNTSPSKRKANSVPATPSSPQGDMADIRECKSEDQSLGAVNWWRFFFIGYSSLPRSTMSEPLGCSDHFCQESAIPCLETVSEEARRHTGSFTTHFDAYPATIQIIFTNFYSRSGWKRFFWLLFSRFVRAFVIGKWIYKLR